MAYSMIFIIMKRITIKLTYAQAEHLLNNLPKGHEIKVSVKDLNKIINRAAKAGK